MNGWLGLDVLLSLLLFVYLLAVLLFPENFS